MRLIKYNCDDDMEGKLKEVAFLFLKLGIIGFGGPAVHIAMMEEEVVRKRGWMTSRNLFENHNSYGFYKEVASKYSCSNMELKRKFAHPNVKE